MKKIYSLLSLSFLLSAAAFGQSTPWIHADSAKSIARPGSGPGNPVWNTASQPLQHNGTSYLNSAILTGGGTNNTMEHAYYYDFGLAVPGNATITGVELIISYFGCNTGSYSKDTISLAYNGVAIGNYIADTALAVNTVDTFGSSTNTWGNILTPAMVNSNSFGVYIDTRSIGVCTFALQDCRLKVHYQNPTGISSVAEATTSKIYPNPARNIVSIEPSVKGTPYTVTDGLGRVVLHGDGNEGKTHVDVSSLTTGLYFVKFGSEVMRFVKQ
jgi:hypothetical protein